MQAFNYHLFVSPDLSGLGPSLISNQPGLFSQIGMSLVAEGDIRVNILDFDNKKNPINLDIVSYWMSLVKEGDMPHIYQNVRMKEDTSQCTLK